MLARRFVLYLLLPLLLLLVVSEASIYLVTRAHLQEQLDANLHSKIESIDETIAIRIAGVRNDLATMQAYRERTQYLQYSRFGQHDSAHRALISLEHNLVSVAALKPRCKAFRFFDQFGRTIINIVDGERDYVEHDASAERWFRRTLALGSGALLVSDVYDSPSNQCPTVTVSTPIRFQDAVMGVFAIDVCVQDLTGDLIRDHQPLVGYVYVVAPTGQVLARTSEAPTAGSGQIAKTAGHIFDGYRGIHSLDSGDGEQVREVYRPLGVTNLGVVVGIPHAEIFAPVDRMGSVVIPLTILGFLLITVVGLIMVRRTVRPIRRLTEAAREIAAGDLDRRIDLSTGDASTGDEIQALAQSFNRMTASLRESQRQAEVALAQAHASATVEKSRAAELERAYDELKLTQRQLVQAEKMGALGQLASGIAHDFNNLLSGIMSCADLLKRVALEPAKHDTYLDTILQTSQRAADLVRQLMAFSRSGPSQSVLVDLHLLLREASGILRRTIDPRISIEESYAARDPVVTGDPAQLQSAFLNMGINARDAMPDGGTLTLATRWLDIDAEYGASLPEPIDPGSYIEISIADTGEGMTSQTLTRIFEPFFTTKDVGAGTGLGLSAVYGTIRSHKGAVRVYSEPNEGTIFRIYLPVALAGGEAWQKPPRAAVIHGSGRILLVDDEPVIRSLGVDMLQWLGYQVEVAEDGIAALELYRDNGERFDLVVADLVMPRMSGRDLLKELRRINPLVRVLIASGFLPNMQEKELRAEGAIDVLEKPYVVSDLSRRVAAAIAGDAPTSPLRVLVVDDTRVNREAIGALLESMGHIVLRARDAREALEHLAEQEFDVLLMDLGLPGMSGLEATALIRAEEHTSLRHLSIIAITGHGSSGDRDECLRAGMDDFLAKPIDLATLRAALSRAAQVRASSIDWASMRTALGGQEALVRTVASVFLDESPSMLADLRTAIEEDDPEEVRLRAHALKGAILNFRGHRAQQHVEALEEQGRSHAMDGALEQFATLELEHQQLREEIMEFLDRNATASTTSR